jgi:hypothetical protein
LESEDWIYPPKEKEVRVETKLANGTTLVETKKEQHCTTTLSHVELTGGQFLVGNHFMRKYYVVFDRDNDKVGIAESNVLQEHERRMKQKKREVLAGKLHS